jgi:hypothetical protein
MIGFEKLLVLRDLLDRTYLLLVNSKVLPSGPVPEDKHLLDWVFEHIKNTEIPPEEIDRMEEEYWAILQEDKDFLQIAQSFFADAVFIERIQQSEPVLRELAENLIVLINSLWGIITYLPLTFKYLRTKDEKIEAGVKIFISAIVVNIKTLIDLDQIINKIREKVSTVAPEGSDLN